MAWSVWLPVTTDDIRLGAKDIYPIDIDQLNEELKEYFEWIDGAEGIIDDLVGDYAALAGAIAAETIARQNAVQAEAEARIADAANLADRFRVLADDLDNVAVTIAEQDFANFEDKQQLREELKLTRDEIEAAYTRAITVAITGDSAVVIELETLTATVGDIAAAVSAETMARVAGDEALAQALVLLSAGAGEQFDWVDIWSFDFDAEGWSGNGTPSVTNGWIRPANHASEPYLVSPGDLDFTGAQYSQVRFRVRKVGSPAWRGWLWWKRAEDSAWSTARRIAIPEPDWTDNIANVIANPAWVGTISQFRLDIGTAATNTNYHDVDWAAVGRPAPGASYAALLAEQAARASADSAMAADLLTLSAQINDAETGLPALGVVVSQTVVTVGVIDGLVSSLLEDVTTLGASIDGKADQTALASLEAEVQALGGGGIVTQGRAIMSLRSQLDQLAELAAEQDFANFLVEQNIRSATADAIRTTETKVSLTEEGLTLLARDVALVKVDLDGKASASAMQVMEARVTAQGNTIASQASVITTVQNELSGKASVTITNGLNSRLTSAEGTVSSHASAINSIVNELPGKASASAVNALITDVSEIDGVVTAHTEALQGVRSALGGDAASVRVRMMADAAPSGFAARYAVRAKAPSGADVPGNYRAAAMFIDVPNNAANPTRIVFEADQFVIRNGSNMKAPFTFINGEASMNVANIGTVNSGLLQSLNGKMKIDLNNQIFEMRT